MYYSGNAAGIRLQNKEALEDDTFLLIIRGNVFELSWKFALSMWTRFIDPVVNDDYDFEKEKLTEYCKYLSNSDLLIELIESNMIGCAEVIGYNRFRETYKVRQKFDLFYFIELSDGEKAKISRKTGKLYENSDTINFWNRVVCYNEIRGDRETCITEVTNRVADGEKLSDILETVKFTDLTAIEVFTLIQEVSISGSMKTF